MTKILISAHDRYLNEFLRDTILPLGLTPLIAEEEQEALLLLSEEQPEFVLAPHEALNGLLAVIPPQSVILPIIPRNGLSSLCDAASIGAANVVFRPVEPGDILLSIKKYLPLTISSEPPRRAAYRRYRHALGLEIEPDIDLIAESACFLANESLGFLTPNECRAVRYGLFELLSNALEHGTLEVSKEKRRFAQNLDPSGYGRFLRTRCEIGVYARRRIRVACHMKADGCSWTIKDNGPGFDHEALTSKLRSGSYDDMERRGLAMAWEHFDSIEFHERGNKVRVWKTSNIR